MGWLTSKYGYSNLKYLEPERVSPRIARERKLAAELARNTQLELRTARRAGAPVSGQKLSSEIKKFLDEARQSSGPKGGSNTPAFIKALQTIKGPWAAQRIAAQREGLQKAKPTGSDKRRYDPTGKNYASTIYGTIARTAVSDRRVVRDAVGVINDLSFSLTAGGLPRFLNPNAVVPCIQRHVRREVMFAKRKAGVGYRKPKRRNENSGVPC